MVSEKDRKVAQEFVNKESARVAIDDAIWRAIEVGLRPAQIREQVERSLGEVKEDN